jgi:hypothetical protein
MSRGSMAVMPGEAGSASPTQQTDAVLTTMNTLQETCRAFNLHWARVVGVGALAALPICYFGIVRTAMPRIFWGGQLIVCGCRS